jgi:hypothetical protein
VSEPPGDDWGFFANEALGDNGASGLLFARKMIQQRIVELEPDDELWADCVGALDALELVLDAIGGLEPPRD